MHTAQFVCILDFWWPKFGRLPRELAMSKGISFLYYSCVSFEDGPTAFRVKVLSLQSPPKSKRWLFFNKKAFTQDTGHQLASYCVYSAPDFGAVLSTFFYLIIRLTDSVNLFSNGNDSLQTNSLFGALKQQTLKSIFEGNSLKAILSVTPKCGHFIDNSTFLLNLNLG